MRAFIRFTDHEGDPLALTNDIAAVYMTSDKDTIHAFPGREVRTAVSDQYRVVQHSTGAYRVRDSFEDIMAKIEIATAAESCE